MEFPSKKVSSSKCLGIEIDEFLTWDTHVNSLSKKVSSGIAVLRKIIPFIPVSNLINVYKAIVEPYFYYCSIVWDNNSDHSCDLFFSTNKVRPVAG